MAVFQGRAHGAATTAKWRTTPDQDQRKLESPLASFPPAPRQLPGVGSGGSEKEFGGGWWGEQGRGPVRGQGDPDSFFPLGLPSLR